MRMAQNPFPSSLTANRHTLPKIIPSADNRSHLIQPAMYKDIEEELEESVPILLFQIEPG